MDDCMCHLLVKGAEIQHQIKTYVPNYCDDGTGAYLCTYKTISTCPRHGDLAQRAKESARRRLSAMEATPMALFSNSELLKDDPVPLVILPGFHRKQCMPDLLKELNRMAPGSADALSVLSAIPGILFACEKPFSRWLGTPQERAVPPDFRLTEQHLRREEDRLEYSKQPNLALTLLVDRLRVDLEASMQHERARLYGV